MECILLHEPFTPTCLSIRVDTAIRCVWRVTAPNAAHVMNWRSIGAPLNGTRVTG